MVRVTIPVIIIAVVGYAFLIAMIVLFLDKYLDLRVIAYTADASRQATNLLHAILTTGPHVEEKLVLKEEVLYNPDFDLKEEHDLLEYDYNLTVSRFYNEFSWEFANILFDMDDECYLNYQRVKGYVEIPVSIHNSKDHEYLPGIAQIEIDDGKICMRVGGNRVCKKFIETNVEWCKPERIMKKEMGEIVISDPGFECDEEISLPVNLLEKCKIININASAAENKVKIILPVS